MEAVVGRAEILMQALNALVLFYRDVCGRAEVDWKREQE